MEVNMDSKRLWVSVSVAAIIGIVLFSMNDRPISAQGAQGSASQGGDAALAEKLEEVLANQRQIMADLAGIKEELDIVKIRVTQSQ